jgi:hypothetical protein
MRADLCTALIVLLPLRGGITSPPLVNLPRFMASAPMQWIDAAKARFVVCATGAAASVRKW